jgi:hypothetical protein
MVSITIVIERQGGVGYQPQDLVPGLFHQWGADLFQDSIFLHHEARLCIANHIPQAFPIFLGTSNWGSQFINTGWDIKQQGGDQENHKMDHWVLHAWHCLQASNSYQVSSTKWLRGHLDVDSNSAQRKRAGVLDYQHWWILTTSRCVSMNTCNIP